MRFAALALAALLCDGGLLYGQMQRAVAGHEDWVSLGATIHGEFGSYVALGVYIGLDALNALRAEPGSVVVVVAVGPSAPCPCVADGLLIATGATPGRGTLRVDTIPAPEEVFATVTITRNDGSGLRYRVPSSARAALDRINHVAPAARLDAVRALPLQDVFTREPITAR